MEAESMVKENKKTEKTFKKTITENKDKILDDTAKKYDQQIMQGENLTEIL